jgi:hypothetical protein
MNKESKQILIISGALIASVTLIPLLATAMWQHVNANQSYIPPRVVSRVDGKPIERCWPTIYPEPMQVESTRSKDGGKWWQVTFHPSQNRGRLFFYTGKDRKTGFICSWLNRDKDDGRIYLMPRYAAVAFAKQHYESVLDECMKNSKLSDKKQFCHNVMQRELNQKRPVVQPEDKDALIALKFDVSQIAVEEDKDDPSIRQ